MPSLLRSTLTCFYCGGRSAQRKTSGLQKWQCTKCDAENWLDENGEITDPPAFTSSLPNRYVQNPVPAPFAADPISPTTVVSDEEPIFCPTCLKNQHLLTESLSLYYPSPNDPSFPAYERAEAEYRESLEERYPQVCERCEPRARERLKKANYDAKADNLGRVMQRLGGRRAAQESEWREWGTTIGGFLWWISRLVQIGWHGLGSMQSGDEDGLIAPLIPTWKNCSMVLIKDYNVTMACSARLGEGPIYFALWMGLLSIWWHPRLRETLHRRYGQLKGLRDYYVMQVISLTVGTAVWCWQTRMSHTDAKVHQGLHFFMIVFSIVSVVSSYHSITVDYTSKVSFKESPDPLIRPKTMNTTTKQNDSRGTVQPPSFARGSQQTTQTGPFSITDLVPPRPRISAPHLLTPPPEADYNDSEAMDWTPSQTPLRPMNATRIISQPFGKHQLNEPSPFHGTLPANVISPAHRLRRPQNQPTFHAASEAKKQSLFTKPDKKARSTRSTGQGLDLTSLDLSLGPSPARAHDDDDDDNVSSPSKSVYSNLSPAKFERPRFFPQRDYQDTGLEGLLARSFTLDEAPVEVRQEGKSQAVMLREEQGQTALGSQISVRALLMLVLVILGGLLWVGVWRSWIAGARHDSRIETVVDGIWPTVLEMVKRFLAI